jgi:hypothetical protein
MIGFTEIVKPDSPFPNGGIWYRLRIYRFILVLKMRSIHPKEPAFEVSDSDKAKQPLNPHGVFLEKK